MKPLLKKHKRNDWEKRIDSFVELVDLAPTLMSIGGVEITDDMELQGWDLNPLMHDEKILWKDAAFCEASFIQGSDIGSVPIFEEITYTEIDGKIGREFKRLEAIAREKGLDLKDLEAAGSPYQYWRPVFKHIRFRNYAMTVRALWLGGQGDDDWMGSLYDLEEDPHELYNLFDSPSYQTIRGDLLEQLKKWDLEKSQCHLITNNDWRHLK